MIVYFSEGRTRLGAWRGITAGTAIRLARYFGTSEEFWMNLQSNCELRIERRALLDKVAAITPLKVA